MGPSIANEYGVALPNLKFWDTINEDPLTSLRVLTSSKSQGKPLAGGFLNRQGSLKTTTFLTIDGQKAGRDVRVDPKDRDRHQKAAQRKCLTCTYSEVGLVNVSALVVQGACKLW
ncbi:hypothetical protein MMC17_005819 [Xylographa soralifera]|nr:hypothetical protein [Xylographa soralifera]